jgi:hypothetical protein
MTVDRPRTLHSAVARLLGEPPETIGSVDREPIAYDAFLAGRDLVRLRGEATVHGRRVTWSMIEKRTEGPGTASAYLVDNAVREAAAYRSGLLADLADGIRAPALLAVVEGSGGELTLYLEDLAPGGRAPLEKDDVLAAARRLGRLAGRWLGRVPDHPWLFRGWIERHSQPAAVEAGLATVREGWADREISERLGNRLDEAVRLIEGQPKFWAMLERLPATLCHHDTVAANVFASPDETLLIDWESIGPGAVGADLASLLFASPRRGDFPSAWVDDLFAPALVAYREGLADEGTVIGDEEVALGVHASIALRWALVRDVCAALRTHRPMFRGSAMHETPERALEELVALVPVLLDSAAEATGLSR